jgi:hypothetical protein
MSEESDKLLAEAKREYNKHKKSETEQLAKLAAEMAKIRKNDIPFPQK